MASILRRAQLAYAIFKRVDKQQLSPLPLFSLSDDPSIYRRSIDSAGSLFSAAFLAAQQAKARAVGSLPAHVVDIASETRDRHTEHPVAQLTKRRWNPLTTARSGMQWLSVRRDTFGTAYVRVEWDLRKPIALWPVSVPVEVLWNKDTGECGYRVSQGDEFTEPRVYLPHEMLSFPTCISTDGGITGRSLAELGAADIGLSIDLTRFYSNVIARGFHPGGWLEHDASLTNDDVRAIAEKNKILSGPDHAGELRIFDKGLKYKTISATMAEADIVKQQEFVLQNVARAAYVHPAKMFDLSRATYSNVEESSISFVTDTITPEISAIEVEFGKLLNYMGDLKLEVKFEMRGLLRGSFKSQNEGYRNGIYGGWFTRAEVREWNDLPFIEGTDDLLQPAAYYRIDSETGEPQAPPDTTAIIQPADDQAWDRIRARLRADGDTQKTREFAHMVLTPIAEMHAIAGVSYEIDQAIKEGFKR